MCRLGDHCRKTLHITNHRASSERETGENNINYRRSGGWNSGRHNGERLPCYQRSEHQ